MIKKEGSINNAYRAFPSSKPDIGESLSAYLQANFIVHNLILSVNNLYKTY